MMRTKQFSLIVGTLATAAVFAFSGQANAGWGSSGSSGGWGAGSSGGYSGWGSSGGYSYGGSSGGYSSGWGSSSSGGGGLFARHRAMKAQRHAMRSSSSGGYSASSGGWGRSGWGSSSSGGYSYGGSSGGYSNGSSGSSGGSSYEAQGNWTPVEEGAVPADAPAPPAEEGAAPADAPADPQTGLRGENTTVSFSVNVPEEAQIFVNDALTSSTGAERTYVSRGLQAGKSYTFHVRAELVRNGKTLTETKKIRLVAGEHSVLAFEFAPNTDEQLAEKAVETKLTLNVPADAKVYLSGRPTSSTGEVREFATTKLVSGKAWADYVVVVTYEKDGQVLSQEKNVTIKAGDAAEVTFDFNNDTVAVNN